MIRNLKVLGLALMAFCAFSAVAASAAMAVNGQLTSDGNVTLTATATGAEGVNSLTAFGFTVECPGSIYTGHKYNVTPHTFIPSGATTATLTPHYKQTTSGGAPNCTASLINGTATFDMNSCDFVVHVGEKIALGEYKLTLDIVCPANKYIEMTLFHTGLTSHIGTPYCKIDVPSQTNLEGAVAKNTAGSPKDIDITGTVTGIEATRTPSPTVLCPNHKTTNSAELRIDVTVQGHNEAGGSTEISLSDEA